MSETILRADNDSLLYNNGQRATDDIIGVLEEYARKLEGVGGFGFIESLIPAAENLHPEKNARRSIFLSDTGKKAGRKALLNTLEAWAGILGTGKDIDTMAGLCDEKRYQSQELLNANLSKAVAEVKDMERSYRNVELFFKNAGAGRIRNVSFINCELEQLKDLDNPSFIDAVAEEFKINYDRLDLRHNYSIMVLPGYLGSNKVVEKWAKIAHAYKVMVVTDFENMDEADEVMELFDDANLAGGEKYRSNVMMTCNWLVGRGRYEELDEDDDLYLPPSAALAGKIYRTLMSQVTAGKKFGNLEGVDGAKFEMKKSEVANLEKMGLVPMVKENGKVMAYSAKTLFNGDNLGLQTYSVVRVFDYVTKVLIDFLNRRAFENFNAANRKDLMGQIVKFFDSITGPGKLIEDFTIRRFEQDYEQKDKIHLGIHMKPYFPAKNFMIKMEGQRGHEGTEWGTDYGQEND